MQDALRAFLSRHHRLQRAAKNVWHLKRRLFLRSEGIRHLKRNYVRLHGREPDTTSPRLFSEKLLVRMIDWHRHGCGQYTKLADKLAVRDYVATAVGAEYLARVYWQGADPEDIPFGSLPAQFVLKTNHGSAHVIRVTGDVDQEQARSKLRQWLAQNHYWKEREYQYLGIVPRAFAEEYLDDGIQDGPLDYRFWCFAGEPVLIQVDNHLHDMNPFYDTRWCSVDISYRRGFRVESISRPTQLDQMLAVARGLARGFEFVRVDLYCVHGRVVFGELTFTPVAGFLKFQPPSWDEKLGRLWPISTTY